MFSRMYSDIFYVFRGCGGRQASDHLSLIPNRLLLLPLLKIACEMLRVHSYWSWTQNNSDVACKFHLKNFQFYIRFLSVWTLRITEVLIFFSTIATPPPSPQLPPSPRDGCLYCVTIKLPVYLMEIYTEEIIALWSHDLDPVSHESRQLIDQCFSLEPELREILLSSSEQQEAIDFRWIRLFVEDLVRRDSSHKNAFQ